MAAELGKVAFGVSRKGRGAAPTADVTPTLPSRRLLFIADETAAAFSRSCVWGLITPERTPSGRILEHRKHASIGVPKNSLGRRNKLTSPSNSQPHFFIGAQHPKCSQALTFTLIEVSGCA